MSPIVMDYLIRAYFTGLFGYPFEIVNAALFEDETGKFKNIGLIEDTDKIPKFHLQKDVESDLSSFKESSVNCY